MNSSRSIALLSTVAAFVVGTLPAHAATTVRSGTFTVKGTVALSANAPVSAPLTATASVYFYDPDGGSQNASITATVTRSGNKANVTLTLPYSWSVSQTTGKVTVTFSISAAATGSPRTQVSTTVPLPANGAATLVNLPAAL